MPTNLTTNLLLKVTAGIECEVIPGFTASHHALIYPGCGSVVQVVAALSEATAG